MKRYIAFIAAIVLTVLMCGCNSNSTTELAELQRKNEELQAQIDKQSEHIKELESKPSSTPVPTPKSTPLPTSSPSKNVEHTSKSSTTNVVFTNKYGTPTTICAHAGCYNYIAPSGDTNCCTVHSNRCLQCGKYIDGDAMYCIDCLVVAFDKLSGK